VYVTDADEVLLVKVAVPIVGACGFVTAVMLDDAELAVELPLAFVATAVKV
jgi:hypothetical protein